MPSTLNPACPLCGLRFSNGPLLDLHIREDHVNRDRPAEPDRNDSGDTGTSPARAGPARGNDRAPSRLRSTDEMVAGTEMVTGTATRRPPAGPAMTTLRRVIGAFRSANDELLRASEAIIRSARAPQPGRPPDAPAAEDAQPASVATSAGRAA
jgi:hypothetical protein